MSVPGAAIFFGRLFMNLYIDESGDLGFTFKRRGKGSSRYLTIACLLTPKNMSSLPKRVVKGLYSKVGQSTKYELKASNLKPSEKVYFAKKAKERSQRKPIYIVTDKPDFFNKVGFQEKDIYPAYLGYKKHCKCKSHASKIKIMKYQQTR